MFVSIAADRFFLVAHAEPVPTPPRWCELGEEGAGVGTSIAVRTLSSGQQFPGGAGLFPLLPLEVTGKQIERIDFLRAGVGTELKIGAMGAPEPRRAG
jgi:hypothetical protein